MKRGVDPVGMTSVEKSVRVSPSKALSCIERIDNYSHLGNEPAAHVNGGALGKLLPEAPRQPKLTCFSPLAALPKHHSQIERRALL